MRRERKRWKIEGLSVALQREMKWKELGEERAVYVTQAETETGLNKCGQRTSTEERKS